MKKTENMELLTSNLFSQISGDKTSRIVALTALREEIKRDIVKEKEELERLEKIKEDIERKIINSQTNLSELRSNKFKVVREIGTQKRLSKKITRLATKDEKIYINTEKFYPESKPKKR